MPPGKGEEESAFESTEDVQANANANANNANNAGRNTPASNIDPDDLELYRRTWSQAFPAGAGVPFHSSYVEEIKRAMKNSRDNDDFIAQIKLEMRARGVTGNAERQNLQAPDGGLRIRRDGGDSGRSNNNNNNNKNNNKKKKKGPKVPFETQWQIFNSGTQVTCLANYDDDHDGNLDLTCGRDDICPGFDENVFCVGAGDGKLERIDQRFNCRPCTQNDTWLSYEYNYPGRKGVCACNPTKILKIGETAGGYLVSFIMLLVVFMLLMSIIICCCRPFVRGMRMSTKSKDKKAARKVQREAESESDESYD